MFEVNLEEPAKRFLKKLDILNQERIIKKLKDLGNNPELGKPLTANMTGIWSLRIGDFSALYQIKKDKLLVLVLKIGHRKNVY